VSRNAVSGPAGRAPRESDAELIPRSSALARGRCTDPASCRKSGVFATNGAGAFYAEEQFVSLVQVERIADTLGDRDLAFDVTLAVTSIMLLT